MLAVEVIADLGSLTGLFRHLEINVRGPRERTISTISCTYAEISCISSFHVVRRRFAELLTTGQIPGSATSDSAC